MVEWRNSFQQNDKIMKNNRRNQRPHRSGFTLIEVMVVLLILVTMAGLGVYAMRGTLEGANRKTAFTYVNELESYVELFELSVGRPPTNEEGLGVLVNCPSGISEAKWGGPYIKSKAVATDPWGNAYQYACPGRNGQLFSIWSYGPDRIDGTDDDIGTWMSSLD